MKGGAQKPLRRLTYPPPWRGESATPVEAGGGLLEEESPHQSAPRAMDPSPIPRVTWPRTLRVDCSSAPDLMLFCS
jgi:hypothetical protein